MEFIGTREKSRFWWVKVVLYEGGQDEYNNALGLQCSALWLLSNQGEKSIYFYFIRVPLRKKSIKVWYSKAQGFMALDFADFWKGLKLGADFTLLQVCVDFGCRAV